MRRVRWVAAVLFLLVAFSGVGWANEGVDRGGIRSGETKSGTIASLSGTDSWKFYGNAGDRVVIVSMATSGAMLPVSDLYAPSGPKEASSGVAKFIEHILLETGLYTILMSDFMSDHTGSYNISLIKIPGACSSPVDRDGGAIQSGQTLGGTIDALSDLDAFYVYGNSGDRMVITTQETSGGIIPVVDLYSPSGVKEASSGVAKAIDHTIVETGLYTLVISDFLFDGTGGYNISLTKIPSDLRPGIYGPYPENGLGVFAFNATLRWDPVAGASGYDLYFGKDVTTALSRIGTNLQTPSMAVNNLGSDEVYYWHVVAIVPGGNVEGPYWWFTALSTSACSGTTLTLRNVLFPEGTNCTCTASVSMTIGSNVIVKNGAKVTFTSPIVHVLEKSHFESGSDVQIKHP